MGNLLDYKDMSEIFENHVIFRPRTIEKRFVKDGKNANCLSDHLYCVVQPTQNIVVDSYTAFMIGSDSLTPDEIVEQNLRELCVHDALNPLFKSHWFQYMEDLIKKCLVVDDNGKKKLKKITEVCAVSVMM